MVVMIEIVLTGHFHAIRGDAYKFTPEGGRIAIRAGSDESFVHVEVRDNGNGIRKEDQELIFDTFSQIDRQYGPGAKGTGLGLAITRSIVNLHGGTITAESQLGEGSAFRFSLPIYSDRAYLINFVADQKQAAGDEDTMQSLVLLRLCPQDGRDGAGDPDLLRQLFAIARRVFRPADDGILAGSENLLAFVLHSGEEGSRIALQRLGRLLLQDEQLRGTVHVGVSVLSSGLSAEECLRLSREQLTPLI